MKRIAKVRAQLLSPESSASLRLKEQPFIILIPKHLLTKFVAEDEIVFELIIENNRISLLGPKTRGAPEANQSSAVTDT